MISILIQQLVGGLAIGSMYALVSLGIALIWAAMKVVNWAQGEFVMVGAYIGLTVYVYWQLPFILALIVSALIIFVLAALIEKFAVTPVRKYGDLSLLMITIGVAILVKQLAIIIWSPIGEVFPSVFGNKPIVIGDIYIVPEKIVIFFIGLGFMVILYLFLFRTKVGKGMRAVSQSRDIAAIMGVNVTTIEILAFGIAGALGALGGVLLAPLMYVEPAMGTYVGIKGFVGAVLGGFGSLPGAALGGLLLGIIESIAAAFLPSGFKEAVAFIILIVILLVKPSGLFSKKSN